MATLTKEDLSVPLNMIFGVINIRPSFQPGHSIGLPVNGPFGYSAKSLGQALFLYIFIHEIRSSGVRASITIVHIRKFYKM